MLKKYISLQVLVKLNFLFPTYTNRVNSKEFVQQTITCRSISSGVSKSSDVISAKGFLTFPTAELTHSVSSQLQLQPASGSCL